ncbi:RHO1 [[Candida] subhashii]|uniref:RHO1 n=1 Tax=[Candida] subhashii TaxID=561895 RepID=A0A8J5UMF2_9ASCO|nr:RHO1 [[Candida] subhashii]KAG7663271.1 RHO1 [[Candida] subhashii]
MSTRYYRVPDIRRKLVVIGDGACGKTCLVAVFSQGKFPDIYIPTIFDNFITDLEIDDKKVELAIWDTAGQEEYDRLRVLSYSNAHAILICFSLVVPDSLDNVLEKWVGEARHFCKDAALILVGCKADLRYDEEVLQGLREQKKQPLSGSEGERVARIIGAKYYIECSAKTGKGVKDVFETATRESLKVGKKCKKNRKCWIL